MIGAKVVTHSLTRDEYNGLCGKVIKLRDNGRFDVMIEFYDRPQKVISLKLENITKTEDIEYAILTQIEEVIFSFCVENIVDKIITYDGKTTISTDNIFMDELPLEINVKTIIREEMKEYIKYTSNNVHKFHIERYPNLFIDIIKMKD